MKKSMFVSVYLFLVLFKLLSLARFKFGSSNQIVQFVQIQCFFLQKLAVAGQLRL